MTEGIRALCGGAEHYYDLFAERDEPMETRSADEIKEGIKKKLTALREEGG